MKKLLFLTSAVVMLTFTGSCQLMRQKEPDKATSEAALKKIDEEWSKAAGSKDVDKTVSYYAPDATLLPPNAATTSGKESIRKIWKDIFAAPGFSGGWTANKVEVANSGEIGYASGTWDFKWKDAKGKPAGDHGKFVEVWKKQSDGSWKCAVDIWNSDLPLQPSATKKK